jgi:hypothetical protein
MGRLRGKSPSPAMVVAIIALVFAVAGTGVASVATISALNKKEKKQTRNIADSEITKKAPGLSVANAANADKLGGLSASSYSLRTATVAANGTVDAAKSDGISQANVSAPVPGVYCFDGLNPAPRTVVASHAGGQATVQTQTQMPGQGSCAGKQFSVATVNDANGLVPDVFTVFVH